MISFLALIPGLVFAMNLPDSFYSVPVCKTFIFVTFAVGLVIYVFETFLLRPPIPKHKRWLRHQASAS